MDRRSFSSSNHEQTTQKVFYTIFLFTLHVILAKMYAFMTKGHYLSFSRSMDFYQKHVFGHFYEDSSQIVFLSILDNICSSKSANFTKILYWPQDLDPKIVVHDFYEKHVFGNFSEVLTEIDTNPFFYILDNIYNSFYVYFTKILYWVQDSCPRQLPYDFSNFGTIFDQKPWRTTLRTNMYKIHSICWSF